MNTFISDRATRRLPLLLVSALAGLLAAALLIAGVRPTQAVGITDINIEPNQSTLIARSGSTTAFVVTVYTGTISPVSDVVVSGVLSSASLGSLTLSGRTNVYGQATITWTVGTVITSGQLIVGDGIISTTANITVTAGPVNRIVVQVNPATQFANSGATSTITATAFDSYDNPVSGRSLSGSVVPGQMGGVSGLGTTGDNGQTYGIWTAGTVPGAGTLYVTDGSVTGQVAITLTVGEPYTMALRANPTYRIVGQTSSLLAYNIWDQFGNQVADGTVVTFSNSLGALSALTDTTVSGSASVSLYSEVAGVATITATSGSAFRTATVTFAPAVPYSLMLQARPASQTVGLSSILTATVYDRFGNLVDPTSVSFTKDLPGTIVSPVTTSGGVATSRVTVTLASVAHITATTGAAVNSTVVTFTPGDASAVTLGAYPLTQTVGLPSVLTATVKDQYGNYVADGTRVTMTNDLGAVIPSPVTTINGIATSSVITTGVGTAHITARSGVSAFRTVTVTFVPDVPYSLMLQARPVSQTVGLSSILTATVYDQFHNLVDPTSVTFDQDRPGTIRSPVTTTKGIATSQVTVTLASVAHITATSGAASNSTVVTFTPGTPMTITVVVDPPNLTPNTGETAMITATAVDSFNNPAPGYQLTGTLVPPSLGSLTGLSRTDSYGRAFGTWTAGTITVSGRLSVTFGTRTGTADIALLLSKPQTVGVQVVSPTLFANSGMTTLITATVLDKGNNPIPGAAVSFSLVPSTAFGSVIASATTDSNGRATSTWTATAGSLPGSGTVMANASSPLGSAIGSAPITLTADAPYSLTLQADPASPIAGVGSSLTAIVTDRFRNLVADGTWVTFTSDLGTVLSPVPTSDGAAFSQINWTGVGPVHITATCGLAKGSTTVNFGPNAPSTAALQANPVTQVVGNSSVVTATLRDEYTNLVRDGTLVTFTSSIGNVSPPTGFTVNGIVTSSINSTKTGVVYITVTSGLAQGTIAVTFRAGAPTTTMVDINPRALLVNTGTSAAITATLFDTYSNPVPGATPTGYLSPPTLGSLSWPSPTTDLKGQAFGRWWAGTVPGSGVLVVNGVSSTVTLLPKQVFLPVVMRDFPPIPTGKLISINAGAENTFQITVTLQVSATVTADYIEWMRFSNDRVNWGNWVTFAPTATWKLDPRNGLKTVYAQFAGHWGGVSAVLSDDIFLFMNGDFSQPNLASWNQDPGNALPVSSPNSAALLGSPAYACNNVPVGYAGLFQSVIMPNVAAGQQLVLRFNEHIYTSDRNIGLQSNLDRFEVLWNSKRVYADMNQDKDKPPQPSYPPPAVCTVYDLGSRDIAVPVTGNPGDTINVVFRIYNQPDAYYNTYVYLDNVRLELEGRSDALSNEAPSLPETPGGYTGR